MNDLLKRIATNVKTTLGQTSHVVKDKVEVMLQKPTLSIEDLAAFIATHPEVSVKTRELLGLRFTTYEVKMGRLTMKLETRGGTVNNILELHVGSPEETLLQFNSYKNNKATDKPLRLPPELNEIVQ
ncbi:hypothetical protein IM538_04345 [Cytobacillus suaedae]|nr:hypothetical protein IM538_04345 [Cytobacillus suaedae]